MIIKTNVEPVIDKTVFVAHSADVIGNVNIAKDASVWYGTVVRGDINSIAIGEGSNIQDNVSVHVDKNYPVKIGKGVSVGHNAVIHGCTIEDDVLIGMGAIILNGAKIGRNTIIGAGALIRENQLIAEGSVVVGNPGKTIKSISAEQLADLKANAKSYIKEAKEHHSYDK